MNVTLAFHLVIKNSMKAQIIMNKTIFCNMLVLFFGIDNISWVVFSWLVCSCRYLLSCSIVAVQSVAKTGQICILDIDSEGVKSMKKTALDPVYIFIQPPSIKSLVIHLK